MVWPGKKITFVIMWMLTSYWLPSKASMSTKKEMVRNTTALLDQLLKGYDKRLRPGFGAEPTLVDVNINIRSMGPISEIDMNYQMDCYFRQSWVDKRLQFTGPLQTLPVSVNILDRLWKPDTHFINGKKSYLHTVTTPNKLLRINRDGRILYSMRLTIMASCPMHLESFPMDTQSCPLIVGSHGYSVRDVMYIWTHGPNKSIKMASDLTLSQFDLVGIPAANETSKRPGDEYFSSLLASFVLRRHMGYFMINVYVPCSLLVVISWVGFWINREATADRIALGITTVLTMAFVGIDNRRDLPKVSYSTALDYFVAICFAFVMASIIQFAGVHFFTKHGSGETFLDSDEEEDEEHLSKVANIYNNLRKPKQKRKKPEKANCVCKQKANGTSSLNSTRETYLGAEPGTRYTGITTYREPASRYSGARYSGMTVGERSRYAGQAGQAGQVWQAGQAVRDSSRIPRFPDASPGLNRSRSPGGTPGGGRLGINASKYPGEITATTASSNERSRYPGIPSNQRDRYTPTLNLSLDDGGDTSCECGYTTDDSLDEDDPTPPQIHANETCMSKFWNCIKGSSAYKSMKQEFSPEGVNSPSRIDQISRCLFPLAFSIFHVTYWMSYLSAADVAGMFF